MIPFFIYSEKILIQKMINFKQNNVLLNNETALVQTFLSFEEKIQQLAQAMNLTLNEYEIDHIALRANTKALAKYWLTHFLKCGTILSNNIVNGRLIYLIKLNQPLCLAGQRIDVIELPFPKDKIYSVEGWEHIEVVIPFLQHETTEEWVKRINLLFLRNQLTTLAVKVSEPKVEGEQLPNPSIAVSFADNRDNHTCIKIHPYNIKQVIEV